MKRKKSSDDVNEGNGVGEIINKLKTKEKLFKSKNKLANDERPKIYNQHRVPGNNEPKTYERRLPGKNDKIILPGMQFDVIRQETAKLPRPNKEIQRQFKLNLKRKIRRRLREYKQLEQMKTSTKSPIGRKRQQKTPLQLSSRFSRLPKSFSDVLKAQSKTSTIFSAQRQPTAKSSILLKNNKRTENFKESQRTHSKMPTLPSLPRADTSTTPSSYKPKQEQTEHPTQSLTRQKRLSPSKNDLVDSSMKLSSTLRFTFSSPLQEPTNGVSKPSTSPPTTNAAHSPTVRSYLAPPPSAGPDFPPSLKKIPSEDLMMLNDFFNQAAAFKQKFDKAKSIAKNGHYIRNNEENKEKQLENNSQLENYHEKVNEQTSGKTGNGDIGYIRKDDYKQQNGEIPNEKHDKQESESSRNAYAKELLEFQRKAIEAEEKRLDKDIKANQQQKLARPHSWGKHVHELEQENQQKQHEVHELFEELADKWKQRRNQALQGRTTSQSRMERPLGGNKIQRNENQVFEQFTKNHQHNLTSQDINSHGNADDHKESQARDAEVHNVLEHLSTKWRNRQNLDKGSDHKSRWVSNGDHANEVKPLDRRANEMNRKRTKSRGNRPETPTKSLRDKDDDDDIVEIAFTPSLRRFSPTTARIHNNENDRKGMDAAITATGKALTNGAVPTANSINLTKNSYFKENTTLYALSGQKVFKVNNGQYEKGNTSKSDHTIYDNDDDDATEDVETVDVETDDEKAPPRYTNAGMNNYTTLTGDSRKKKVNKTSITYNLTGMINDNVNDDIEDDYKKLTNSYDINSKITSMTNGQQGNNDSNGHNNYNDNNYNLPNNIGNKTVSNNVKYDNKLRNLTDMNKKNNDHNITSDNSNYNNDDSTRNDANYNEEVPHDNRLLYILGDPEQVSKKQRNRKKIEELVDKVKLNDNEEYPRKAVLDKDLRAKLKAMEIRVLDAHQKVSKDLEDIERHLTDRYERLQNSIQQAKSLTKGMDNKINDTVLHILKLARISADQAKTKINLVHSK